MARITGTSRPHGPWPTLLLVGGLLAGAVVTSVPILWMISASFKVPAQIFTVPVQWFPSPPTLANFETGLARAPFDRYFLNSIVVSGVSTATNLLFSTMAAYGFAKFRFRGSNVLFFAVISTLMLPFQVIVVPLYLMIRFMGLLDTYPGLILPGAITAFGVFQMRQYMYAIPTELISAARVDGASELQTFLRVILPLCRTPLVALGVLTFLDTWNSLLWPLVAVSSTEMRTVTLGLTEFQTAYGTLYGPLMAVSVLATIPIVILVILTQRQFVRGVLMSGLKG